MTSWPRPSHQTFVSTRILSHANEMWLVLRLGFLRQIYFLPKVNEYVVFLIRPTQGWTVRPVGSRQHSIYHNIVYIEYIDILYTVYKIQ